MLNDKRGTRAVSSTSLTPTLPALFAEQARQHRAAPAVRSRERAWSFGEWSTGVNRLTRALAARGVGRGSLVPLVPLVFRPTPEALQAMLAVMQTGAAYVPLDPAY